MTAVAAPITLEPLAGEKVAEFLANAPNVDERTCLRLGVRSGGCSGFQYALALDHRNDEDLEFESEGARVIVARDVFHLVAGSRIVYRDLGLSAGFDVENPQATAACGCGSSFRVDEGAAGCSEPDGPPEESAL